MLLCPFLEKSHDTISYLLSTDLRNLSIELKRQLKSWLDKYNQLTLFSKSFIHGSLHKHRRYHCAACPLSEKSHGIIGYLLGTDLGKISIELKRQVKSWLAFLSIVGFHKTFINGSHF